MPAGEGLPEGWLKKYRPRKTRFGSRIRRDMIYVDPTNTYEFRSLKDVNRYLESGDISNCAVTPNKRKFEDQPIAGNQAHDTGRPSGSRQLDTAHESNSENKEDYENMPSSEPNDESRDNLIELELQKARMNNQFLEHESATTEEANVKQKPKEKKQRTKSVKQITAPLRASPRLTALKVNQEANNMARNGHGGTETVVSNLFQPSGTKNRKSKANSSSGPQYKDGAHTTSVSESAEDIYPSALEQTLGASVACSLTDARCQNVPSGQPALQQQLGLIETTDAMPGCSLSALLGSIWSDPCLEFAFRTLTGDIPVLDNNLAVSGYFLPPQDLNKGMPPNCSSSTYDGTRKSHPQVNRARLPMARPLDKLYSSGWFPPQ